MISRFRRKRKRKRFDQKEPLISMRLLKEASIFLIVGAGAVVLAITLATAFGLRVDMAGDSMAPTILNGQYVLVDRLHFQFARPDVDDIIVFRSGGSRARTYIRRVVAVSGDRVQVKNGVLYVNDEPKDDPAYDKMENAGIAAGGVTLGNGEYFVLGDNRNNSEDSRSENIGMVRLSSVIGKAWRISGKTE